jgi:nucleosome binding factor SPN SPT16 subunit
VIIHFHLKVPILVGEEMHQGIQFLKEVGHAVDNFDKKAKSLFDIKEKAIQLNQEVSMFAKLIEKQSYINCLARSGKAIEFDMPIGNCDFSSFHHKSPK